MIPQTIPIPPGSFLLEIQPRHHWAALLLARMHERDDEAVDGVWICRCRCCQWARARAQGGA